MATKNQKRTGAGLLTGGASEAPTARTEANKEGQVKLADTTASGVMSDTLSPQSPKDAALTASTGGLYGAKNTVQNLEQDPEQALKMADQATEGPVAEATGIKGMKDLGKTMLDAGPMPEWEAERLDPNTQAILSGQERRADKSVRDLVSERLAGTEYGKQALEAAGQDAAMRNIALGGTNQDMLAAIQKRAERNYGSEAARQKRGAMIEAPEQKFERMNQVLKNKARQLQIQRQQAERERIYKRNKQNAKNQALGSILGLAGMAIGGMAGGPAGASAGGQAGSAAAGPQDTQEM